MTWGSMLATYFAVAIFYFYRNATRRHEGVLTDLGMIAEVALSLLLLIPLSLSTKSFFEDYFWLTLTMMLISFGMRLLEGTVWSGVREVPVSAASDDDPTRSLVAFT